MLKINRAADHFDMMRALFKIKAVVLGLYGAAIQERNISASIRIRQCGPVLIGIPHIEALAEFSALPCALGGTVRDKPVLAVLRILNASPVVFLTVTLVT